MKQKAYLKTGMLPAKQIPRSQLAAMIQEARQRDGKATRMQYDDAMGYQFKETPFNPYTYLIENRLD